MAITQEEIEKFGTTHSITGFITGNGISRVYVHFPDSQISETEEVESIAPTDEELERIFFQMDRQDITNKEKVVLRKSQRQIDSNISWKLFMRDEFTCRYCNATDKPLTVDHIILWEDGGATVENNMQSACKKCNHTRGSLSYEDWMKHPYYLTRQDDMQIHLENIRRGEIALTVPLQKRRSR